MANNVDVKDAAGATQTMKTTDTLGVHTPHHIVDSSALPTGAATETTLAAVETAVDGIETLLGGTLTVTGPLTDTQLRATAVPVSAASLPLPTGAATETTLAAALTSLQTIDNAISGTGVNISQIGGSAARTADLDTDVGTDTYPVIGLAVGGDGGATIVSQNNPMPVNGTIAATQSGTWDAIAINNVRATTVATDDGVIVVGFARDDALTTVSDEDNTYSIGRVDSTGALWTRVTSIDGALPAGTNNIGDVDVLSLPAIPAGTNNIGDVDVLTVPAPLSTTGGGTEATALRVTLASDSTGVVSVDDNGGSLTVDGTVAISGTVTVDLGVNNDVVQATASNLNAQVVGDIAHDAGDSGNPVKIGGKARTTNPTAVANADRVDATFDDIGRQVVVMGQVRDLMTHQHTQIASSSSETTILTAVASTFLDLTQLVLTNQTATAVNVTIKDATAGTTRMIIALAANGGAVLNFPRPVTQASANNNWTATLSSAAVTVNIFAQAERNV